MGRRGTAKSVMARGVHALLPPIEVVADSWCNADPEDDREWEVSAAASSQAPNQAPNQVCEPPQEPSGVTCSSRERTSSLHLAWLDVYRTGALAIFSWYLLSSQL